MMQYNKIHVLEGIDVNKTSASKEILRDIGFKFEEHVCNKCHDLLVLILEMFILILIKNGTKSHGKNLFI